MCDSFTLLLIISPDITKTFTDFHLPWSMLKTYNILLKHKGMPQENATTSEESLDPMVVPPLALTQIVRTTSDPRPSENKATRQLVPKTTHNEPYYSSSSASSGSGPRKSSSSHSSTSGDKSRRQSFGFSLIKPTAEEMSAAMPAMYRKRRPKRAAGKPLDRFLRFFGFRKKKNRGPSHFSNFWNTWFLICSNHLTVLCINDEQDFCIFFRNNEFTVPQHWLVSTGYMDYYTYV